MRKQQQIWEEEHKTAASIPRLATKKPSSDVVAFIDYLKTHHIFKTGKLVDIGCGKGRNTIYLAKQGFIVYALDYIQHALDITKSFAEAEKVADKIHLFKTAIDSKWPFAADFFDIAIDCFSSIDIETRQGREVYRDEMFRTLKPGAYGLVTAVSITDKLEHEISLKSPGLEPNSVIWPTNQKFQKNYDARELKEFYETFDILELKEIKAPVKKLGREYTGCYYWMVLKKPI